MGEGGGMYLQTFFTLVFQATPMQSNMKTSIMTTNTKTMRSLIKTPFHRCVKNQPLAINQNFTFIASVFISKNKNVFRVPRVGP